MPGRRETAELVGALLSSKKDALIDTLRTTLDQARVELERSRARAEAELSRRRGPRTTVQGVLGERRGRQEGFLAGLAERRKEALAKLLR